jgi:hypothetical protein
MAPSLRQSAVSILVGVDVEDVDELDDVVFIDAVGLVQPD